MVQSRLGNIPKANREVRVDKLTDHDVVILASGRWDNPYASAALSVARALSRRQRVFLVDNPVTVTEYIRKREQPEMKRRREALFDGDNFFCLPDPNNPSLIAVTPKATLPVNWLSNGKVYSKLSAWNTRRVADAVNRLCRIFGIRKYILLNSFNPLLSNIENHLAVAPAYRVYQCVDDIAYAPYLSKHGVRLENQLIASYDLTVVTSSHLLRMKEPLANHVKLLPNAADTELFSKTMKETFERPRELQEIREGNKVITYIGNICQRIDYVLLKKLATVHRDKTFVLIGPQAKVYGNRKRTYADHADLQSFDNIRLIGHKPMEVLPAYLYHSDCCIIPFLCNDLTRSIYPLKINEYLSAGKPVVTTPFSEDVINFSSVCYVSENDKHFVSLIDKAIEENSSARQVARVLYCASNNWEARAHHFIDLIVEFSRHRDGRPGEQVRRTRAENIYK
jgi:teichuronic acid biosynthesis glycosyltransferase TuaH